MSPWIRRSRRATLRVVDRGAVFCPRQQRDVEVDLCMACPELVAVRGAADGAVREVRCTPAPPPGAYRAG